MWRSILSSLLIFFLFVQLFPVVAAQSNSSHSQSKDACKNRSSWIKHVKTTSFSPTNDCRGLNEILKVVNGDRKFDYCKAEPAILMKYINSSLPTLKPQVRPRPCEVLQWYYGNPGGKSKQSFCQNATKIAVEVNRSRKKDAAQTQPYYNVIHGARGLCHEKFKADLQSIGEPDVTGIGVSCSPRRLF